MAGKPKTLIVGSKAEQLFRLFDRDGARDGVDRLARLLGVHRTVLVRWGYPVDAGKRGTGGVIPASYNADIREAAHMAGVPYSAVEPLLENVCPACGRPLLEGRRL